jgi:hypothetical protein
MRAAEVFMGEVFMAAGEVFMAVGEATGNQTFDISQLGWQLPERT